MTESPQLGGIGRERFSDAVEASYRVNSRPQFFVWTQSSVQALLPHEILLCGIFDGSRLGVSMHRFSSSRYFRQEQFDAVSDPVTGLVPRLLSLAESTGNNVVFSPVTHPKSVDLELQALVEANEMRNMASHLVPGARGKFEAYYVFSRVNLPLDEHSRYVIELLVPHLHNAFLRVLATERQVESADTRRAGRIVTRRQAEILNLIKIGKTNSEIADLLECSPWTIKNHIQAILRRLDTNTRTHAIARAISLGILQSD